MSTKNKWFPEISAATISAAILISSPILKFFEHETLSGTNQLLLITTTFLVTFIYRLDYIKKRLDVIFTYLSEYTQIIKFLESEYDKTDTNRFLGSLSELFVLHDQNLGTNINLKGNGYLKAMYIYYLSFNIRLFTRHIKSLGKEGSIHFDFISDNEEDLEELWRQVLSNARKSIFTINFDYRDSTSLGRSSDRAIIKFQGQIKKRLKTENSFIRIFIVNKEDEDEIKALRDVASLQDEINIQIQFVECEYYKKMCSSIFSESRPVDFMLMDNSTVVRIKQRNGKKIGYEITNELLLIDKIKRLKEKLLSNDKSLLFDRDIHADIDEFKRGIEQL